MMKEQSQIYSWLQFTLEKIIIKICLSNVPGRNCTAGNDRIWELFRWNSGTRIPQAVPTTRSGLFLSLPSTGWDHQIRMRFPARFPTTVPAVLVCRRIPSRFPPFPQPLPCSIPDVTFSTEDLLDDSISLAYCVILIRLFRDWIIICGLCCLCSSWDGHFHLRNDQI